MKILFFIDSLGPGGKERRLLELMKQLKQSTDVQFELVLMGSDVHYKEVFNLGIRIHYLIRKRKKDISIFKKLYSLCKEYKPDILHCWDSMTAVYSVPACKLLHIKLVNGMVVDTPSQQNILNKHWLRARLFFQFADIVIGNSKAGLAAYRAPQKKSACIYNGMDLSRFENLKEPACIRKEISFSESSDLFVAGMVAAFEDRKDYKTLITAAKSLISKHGNIRFILVGDGSNLAEIKNSVPVSLADKIIFAGKRSDVESIVNIFDVGILLTNSKLHGEGISNSIIEYMALGKPVIATRGGGTNEVVIDNENGFLIDPERDDQLEEKIESFMNDRKLKEHFGQNGNKMVRDKFDSRIMTKQYVSVYQRLLKENNN